MFCSNCGNQVADGTRFCPHCGGGVASANVSIPEAPVAPDPMMQYQMQKNAVRHSEMRELDRLIGHFSQKADQYDDYDIATAAVNHYSRGARKAMIVWGAILAAEAVGSSSALAPRRRPKRCAPAIRNGTTTRVTTDNILLNHQTYKSRNYDRRTETSNTRPHRATYRPTAEAGRTEPRTTE